MRLIDADELKIKLADELSDALGETDFTDGLQHGLKLAISLAEETPLADAEPIRHGHWIEKYKIIDTESEHYYVCSECLHGDIHNDNVKVHYCWNCGAEMDYLDEVEE